RPAVGMHHRDHRAHGEQREEIRIASPLGPFVCSVSSVMNPLPPREPVPLPSPQPSPTGGDLCRAEEPEFSPAGDWAGAVAAGEQVTRDGPNSSTPQDDSLKGGGAFDRPVEHVSSLLLRHSSFEFGHSSFPLGPRVCPTP